MIANKFYLHRPAIAKYFDWSILNIKKLEKNSNYNFSVSVHQNLCTVQVDY